MAQDNILRQYGDASIREDVVLNAIEYLTARETQVFNMLPKGTAIAMVHSYLTDTLATAGSLAVEEGADYSATALTTPTRLTNIVEIVAKNFKVSRTQQQIAHYTGENELNRQVQKSMWDWANAAEFDLVRGVLTSGASGTAPTLSGVIQATSLANNHTTQASTTIYNTSILDSLMANSWATSNGDVPTELLMGSWIRQKMDQAIQKTNVVVNAPGITDIVRTVSTYQTSFGTLNLRTHRYIQAAADGAVGRILAIRPDKLKIAFLQGGGKPYVDTDLARSGDYDNRAIVGKFTLEVHNQNSHFFSDGFSTIS